VPLSGRFVQLGGLIVTIRLHRAEATRLGLARAGRSVMSVTFEPVFGGTFLET
jgi:hypothetical protein